MKNFLLHLLFLFAVLFSANDAYANSPTTTVSPFLKVLSPNHIWYTVTSDSWTGSVNYGRNRVGVDSILIGNHYYHSIFYSPDSIGNNWTQTHKYTREIDGKLWVLDSIINDKEILVMDMNLQVNDEFVLNQGDNKLYVISSKVITDFQGRLRKVLALSCNPDEEAFVTWIEGIGPIVGVFEAALGYCYVDFNFNSLTCFYDQDLQVWTDMASFSCWAKPVPPISYSDISPRSTWYSTTWLEDFGGQDCPLGINTINVISNTIIKQQWCQVLGVTDNGVFNSESALPFYRKDNKMFFYEDDEWKLLYDFNAGVGDTVTYYISSKAKYYQLYGIYPDTIYKGPYQLIIKAIDYVYTESNEPLKRFRTEQIPNGNYEGHYMRDIVENAGSASKLFGNYEVISLPECLHIPQLRCFEEFPTLLYKFLQGACDTLSAVKDLINSGISIYPNPGIDQLIINKEDHNGLKYSIYSIAGKLIITGEINPAQEGLINTAAWYSGMYIVVLRDNEGRSLRLKWAKY